MQETQTRLADALRELCFSIVSSASAKMRTEMLEHNQRLHNKLRALSGRVHSNDKKIGVLMNEVATVAASIPISTVGVVATNDRSNARLIASETQREYAEAQLLNITAMLSNHGIPDVVLSVEHGLEGEPTGTFRVETKLAPAERVQELIDKVEKLHQELEVEKAKAQAAKTALAEFSASVEDYSEGAVDVDQEEMVAAIVVDRDRWKKWASDNERKVEAIRKDFDSLRKRLADTEEKLLLANREAELAGVLPNEQTKKGEDGSNDD